MVRKFFLNVLLFTLFLICSCNTNKKVENHINFEYYHLINDAENQILNEDYTNALLFYKKAFKTNIKPIANNCFTATQVSASCNNLNDFIFFSRKAFKSGITYDDLINDSICINFIKNNNLGKRLENYFIKDIKIYKKNINQKLKDEILKLSSIDNKWKIYYNDSLSIVDRENKENYSKIYDSIVTEIVEKKLMLLIEKHGYPGERSIGIEKVGNNSKNNFSFSNNYCKLILLHYYSYPRSCSYNNILKRELQKGNLIPEDYATIIDFQTKFSADKCNENYYYEWQEPETFDLNEINFRRKEIGLELYEQKIKKINRGKLKCKQLREEKKYKIIKLFDWCG